MSGLTQRRKGGAAATNNFNDDDDDVANLRRSANASAAFEASAGAKTDDNSANNDFDYDNDNDDKSSAKRANRLTLMEEILLMGLKDAQVLRGCILMELSFRKRIATVQEVRKRPFSERLLHVIDDRPTGEVLLDEALRMIKTDSTQSIASWIDLMSGETWNLMSFNYQLKQVRERIAKGLVDKGVLRTEKRNFILFDMATHPVADYSVKEQLVAKTVDTLLSRGAPPTKQTVAMCCAAYAANVLENALVGLNHIQREQAFTKVDEMLQNWASMGDKAKAGGVDDVMAGVLSVYTKMDALL
ncbi:GPP34-domain-containing protein [Rhizoclosmatium globosum]|uniref:GPP34-domain-containing protein n=1 Tax=Rhizoclosmatium globosum TaxID=329046 RepID=A0A1Y2CAV2_9FUNG|nr:GPP34-domain-containing protein [Rhizoclosmatium globosum]|eukprot:ORY44066.1 GPP34-domain-containing protein [Rhizoclosmatium globosum]